MQADHGAKLDESLGLHQAALDLDPANGAYLDSLGWAYFRLGKYELAEDNLTKASQHMSTDPTVHDHLGDLYQKTGRLKLAATHWERALRSGTRPFLRSRIPRPSPKCSRNSTPPKSSWPRTSRATSSSKLDAATGQMLM